MDLSQIGFVLLVIVLFITLISLARSARVVSQYEKGLVLRLGKYRATVDSGLTFLVPVIEDMLKVDMRERVINVEPQKVIKESGADILRLWVCATDYADDQRIGPEILKNTIETYRKLRNTIRWMLGTLHHFKQGDAVPFAQMPELERLMLHQLAAQSAVVRKAYAEFDYKTVVASLSAFMNTELSAFYFDIRKDMLYCDPPSSSTWISMPT